jgi:hypothetical protein
MADFIITSKYEDGGKIYYIYQIIDGNKKLIKKMNTYEYEDAVDYINENYEYARILCGKGI